MHIDIVSDVICPWCYIGKRKFDQVLNELAGEVPMTVRWRPYQLNASIPREGLDRRQSLAKKFGSEDKAKAIYKHISEVGAADGIDFRFDAIQRTPNTVDAHRVIYWAMNDDLRTEAVSPCEPAEDRTQHLLVEELFQLYFEQGQDLGDKDVLIGACRKVGIDPLRISELLEGTDARDLVNHEHQLSRDMGISGVPCFIINNQYILMGAQDPVRLTRGLRKIYAEELETIKNGDALEYGEYGSL